MSALPCQSDIGQRLLDQRAAEEARREAAERDLNDMAESSYWLRKWHREDDSMETVQACCDLGLLLMLSDGLPCGESERADNMRDAFEAQHDVLRRLFDLWATQGKPSQLDRYQEAERRAREADEEDEE